MQALIIIQQKSHKAHLICAQTLALTLLNVFFFVLLSPSICSPALKIKQTKQIKIKYRVAEVRPKYSKYSISNKFYLQKNKTSIITECFPT